MSNRRTNSDLLPNAALRARLGLTTTSSGMRKLKREAKSPFVTGTVVKGWENTDIDARTTVATMRRRAARSRG
jgi:hypothetical protein